MSATSNTRGNKKRVPKERNHLVPLVLFRKAGEHKKPGKAIRRKEKSKMSSGQTDE